MPKLTCIDCNKPFIGNRSTAKHCGCLSKPFVCRVLIPKESPEVIEKVIAAKENNIVTKKKHKINKRYLANKAIRKLSIEKTHCVECNAIGALFIHHIDKNLENNTLDNLQVLCKACHRLKHPDLSDYLF